MLGDPTEPPLAARLAGLDDDAASRAADALAEAVIFEPGRQLAFVHPLVRSSVYSELSSRESAQTTSAPPTCSQVRARPRIGLPSTS